MMTYRELPSEELILKLSAAGHYPHPDLINAIWDRRSETEPLLLVLFREASDDDWGYEDDPHWYRFFHAGSFLLSWQNLDALQVFADLFMNDNLQQVCEWFEEDLYHYGPAAIPSLKQVFEMDSGGEWHYGRVLSGDTLARIATYYPDTRDDVSAILRGQLPSVDAIPYVWEEEELVTAVVMSLAIVADEVSCDRVLALYDADLLDTSLIERGEYLSDIRQGFQPQKPPSPYDIRAEYQSQYEWHQRTLRQREKERQQQRETRVRKATPRSGTKIGRNAPCPCGSGMKYKRCHGRPGDVRPI